MCSTLLFVQIVGLALIDVQTLTIKMCEVTVSNHYSNLEVKQ